MTININTGVKYNIIDRSPERSGSISTVLVPVRMKNVYIPIYI